MVLEGYFLLQETECNSSLATDFFQNFLVSVFFSFQLCFIVSFFTWLFLCPDYCISKILIKLYWPVLFLGLWFFRFLFVTELSFVYFILFYFIFNKGWPLLDFLAAFRWLLTRDGGEKSAFLSLVELGIQAGEHSGWASSIPDLLPHREVPVAERTPPGDSLLCILIFASSIYSSVGLLTGSSVFHLNVTFTFVLEE